MTVQVLKGARVVAENKKAPNAAGVNKLIWNMRMDAVTIPGVAAAPQTGRGFGGGFGGGAARPNRPSRRSAAPWQPTRASTPSW